MYAFLNANPSYGRFVSIVGLERFKFVQFLQTGRHFKNKEIFVDIMIVFSEYDESKKDDQICAVHDSMFEYIEVYNG
ncbi:hypothetical protein AVV44_gp106 [Cronobacter phage S13]|jgi:hypothetical protein|uniref:Uncharacterized protein n=1 Tax=Cronobacter phage LPCS28 TaxID=2924885 RepID=A0AAE9GBQ9_9CAUD|nr:hypothetical protein AVV44_gp106 [Cronobacter phage S13]YP_010665957.1 hypothetical protein PQB73_gp067 [Cronobacter phage LPCS28]AIA64905.1 hypothetical protein S13_106 [Cronobacter phage S13]UNY47146.1 hypothetical protein EHEKIMEA_00264 [Cronobacter phage LPCS28]